MSPTHSELTFSWTPTTVVFGVILLSVTIFLGFLIWKRSLYSTSSGLLESLRILIVTCVVLTLNQPEWRETFEPDRKPVIAVLRDDSASMDTEDISRDESPATLRESRKTVATRLTTAESWNALNETFEVVIAGFSAPIDGGDTGTDFSTELDDILERYPTLAGAVLVSDGDWNSGEPPVRAATKFRMRGVPIFTVPVGSETRLPDLAVTAFDVPTFGIAGKPVRLPFTLTNSLARDYTTTLEIKTNEGETITSEVTIPAMGRIQDTILWTPKTVGDFQLTLTLPVNDEEHDATNNSITAPIAIRKEELKVLIIESFPRWEYRYLRNALVRDPGVEVRCLLFHPDITARGGGPDYLDEFPDAELLSTFDVIVLGDVGIDPGQLSLEQAGAIKRQVATQAAGLVLLPGFRGNQMSLLETDLEALFPVYLDPAQPRGWGAATPGQFELTEIGASSLLTRLEDTESANSNIWASLPGFQWYAGVTRAKAGSEVLATHSSETNRYGRIPLIVTKTYGTGKILFMGTDGAWRWRKGVEDRYHYRFWGQVARWMAYQRNMASDERMRLFFAPDRPRTGDTLTLNANVMSVGGEPLQVATVNVQITTPSGKVETVRLQPGGDEQWGLFTASYVPSAPGEHKLTMTCLENGGTLDTSITVQGTARELVGQPARYDAMEEIARISRGEMLLTPDLSVIQQHILSLPEPAPIERRLRLWAHPLWIGGIILLLTVFWIGRKVAGVV
ncbi:MAG: hypothetical protein KBF76_00335 [Verrucomicrobiales bacterium]|nr:hypothetical protein [Verrucomicrobiales bacterium]